MYKAMFNAKRGFMAVLLAVFVILQIVASFCTIYSPVPGTLSCSDTEVMCCCANVFDVASLSHGNDNIERLALLNKFFVVFFGHNPALHKKFKVLHCGVSHHISHIFCSLRSVILLL